MKALTVVPGQAGSARLDEVDEPPETDGPVLVDAADACSISGNSSACVTIAVFWS